MKFILGTKQNMVQFFDDEGKCTPATVLSVGPVVVTQVKDMEKDGYKAVQIGYGTKNPKNINKAIKGHIKEAGNFRFLREFRLDDDSTSAVGDTINASVFEKGDKIVVSGITKGKGFQGVVKRHGFAGGPRTHGQKHDERGGGSIGAMGIQRVLKGVKMPGRMGSDRVTVKNLKVLAIDEENNTLLVSGAVPGRRGTVIEVRG